MKRRTTRERIASLITEPSPARTPTELKNYFEDLEVSDIISHLEHISKSQEVLVQPPECVECGFNKFDNRLNVPSRCPDCKSERIAEPRLKIKK